MRKTVKLLLIAIGVLLALAVAAAGMLAATFDPNGYKPQIIRLVQEKKQRTLSIPGNIKLTFFPRIGADLGKVGISEHAGSAEFAAIDSARVSLALMPLLSRQLVVDKITIDGLRAHLRREKDGSTNVDDLLSKEESSGRQIAFDIDGVDIRNADLVFEDRQQARRLELRKLDLRSGRIANGVPGNVQLTTGLKADKPRLDAKLALKTGFRFDLDKKRYVLDGMEGQVDGAFDDISGMVLKIAGDADLQPDAKRFALKDIRISGAGKRGGQPVDLKLDIPGLAVTDQRVSGSKLSGEFHFNDGARTIALVLAAPTFEGSPQSFKLPALTVDASVKDAKLDAKAKLSGALAGDIDKLLFTSPQLSLALSGKQGETALNGSLATPFSFDMAKQLVELSNIAANFTLPNPGGGTLALRAGGRAGIQLGKRIVTANLKGSLDGSAFDAKLGMSGAAPAAYTFDIGIDRLDLDRYRAKPSPNAAQPAPAPAKETPLDLSALKDLRAEGSMRVGALKAMNLRAANVRLDLHAAGGKLSIDPFAATFYGGNTAGAMSASASSPVRFSLRQTMTGIQVGPLLKDAIDKSPVEGRGNVQLDVAGSGATVALIRKSLGGSARLELRDGAVHGVNIAQAVRNAKTKIGEVRGDQPPQTGTAAAGEKTDFSEFAASFRIANGIAHNDDLNIKSPLVRVGGSGDIDLGAERLEYLARATVVSTLQGQGGPELQALKGLTVPVKLSGPFSALSWRIDFSGMARELAQQKVDEKKEEVRSKARQAIDEQKGKVQEQLQDRLKGLLGR
jgi:AsmA protein